VHCKTCRYSLNNLTEHRCPECGTAFDPNDPTTFDTAASRRTQKRQWLLKLAGFTLLAIIPTYSIASNLSHPRRETALILILNPILIAYLAFELFKARPR
jgi:hypothetical protein